MIKGQVSSFKNGLRSAFNKPKISASQTKDSQLDDCGVIPGTTAIAAYKATVLINKRNINFDILSPIRLSVSCR